MSGSRFLLDTNIVLHVLNGNEGLNNLLDDQDLYLAQISQLELLSYPKITETETLSIHRFIAQMPIVEINATHGHPAPFTRMFHELLARICDP